VKKITGENLFLGIFPPQKLPVDMHHFCRGEPVEVGGGGMGIGPDILGINKVADVEIRKFSGQGDGIECIAGRPEYC
jgi:hypothetical protein